MTNSVALDTNVLIYLHHNSYPGKRSIAEELLSGNPYISAQVISEYLNVARRLLPFSKEGLLVQTSNLLTGCTIIPIMTKTLMLAASFVKNIIFNFLIL